MTLSELRCRDSIGIEDRKIELHMPMDAGLLVCLGTSNLVVSNWRSSPAALMARHDPRKSAIDIYNRAAMMISVRAFAKINLGLRIGPLREDGFHELLAVYQTIGLHDVIRVSLGRGSGIEIRCLWRRVREGGEIIGSSAAAR